MNIENRMSKEGFPSILSKKDSYQARINRTIFYFIEVRAKRFHPYSTFNIRNSAVLFP